MPESIPPLWDVLNSKWSVQRKQAASILTYTLCSEERGELVIIGLLAHDDFVVFGFGAYVDISITLVGHGKLQRMSSRLNVPLEDILQNTSQKAPPRLLELIGVSGTRKIGLCLVEDLEAYIQASRRRDTR